MGVRKSPEAERPVGKAVAIIEEREDGAGTESGLGGWRLKMKI